MAFHVGVDDVKHPHPPSASDRGHRRAHLDQQLERQRPIRRHAGAVGGRHDPALNGRRVLELARLGQRHRHRLAHLGAFADGEQVLDDGRRASEVAHARVRSGDEEPGEGVRELTAIGLRGPAVPRIGPETGDLPLGQGLFQENCAACHEGVKREAGLSVLSRSAVLAPGESGMPGIVPGRPGASELIRRITHPEPAKRMPLHADPLPRESIRKLERWIRQGAKWPPHWAYVKPEPVDPPAVSDASWPKNGIDRFILARLEKEGLTPAPEADKASLLRRVSFDLIGLPPTPDVIAAYLADASADAYEKQVDRLLASPHYGERWSAMWLDLARYADTKGYEKDWNRPMWPYRDWVIDAFNRNVPYDQFVITQLAGDLLVGRSEGDEGQDLLFPPGEVDLGSVAGSPGGDRTDVAPEEEGDRRGAVELSTDGGVRASLYSVSRS